MFIEPRYKLDREDSCFGCGYFKAAKDCTFEPLIEDLQCGGACDSAKPCFEGSLNVNMDSYFTPYAQNNTQRTEVLWMNFCPEQQMSISDFPEVMP